MPALSRPWGHFHYRDHGPRDGLPILLMNSLGTDLRIWDAVVDQLPDLRIVRCDKRGNGLSATPLVPWTLADLADDALALLDHLQIDRAVVGGCSIGSMIAIQIGATSPQRVAGLFLTSTGLRAGTAAGWQTRIDAVRAGGMAAVTPWVVEHWFTTTFLATAESDPWATMVSRNDPVGYISTCMILAETDLAPLAATIRRPTLFAFGSKDPYNSPESVGAAAALIPGSRIEIMQELGHILPLEDPAGTAQLLHEFHGTLT